MLVITKNMEDRTTTIISMSKTLVGENGRLFDGFQESKTLVGENGWKCPNCAFKLVSGSPKMKTQQ